MTKNELIAAKAVIQNEIKGLFEKHGVESMPSDALGVIESKQAEVDGYDAKIAELGKAEELAAKNAYYFAAEQRVHRLPAADIKSQAQVKTLGEMFVESKAFGRKEETASFGDFDVKANFLTSSGWSPEPTRSGIVELSAQRPLNLLDFMPSMTVNVPVFRYMQESTFTNNAAEVAEAGTYAEGALALSEATADIRKVGVSLPVSDEQLEDVAGVREYLDSRLGYMVRQRLEGQILGGNGTAPNIRGILNVAGILTQARSTDNHFDAIFKAITKVEAQGFAQPKVIVMHPTDFQTLRLMQSSTGMYIVDNPVNAGAAQLFGLPVLKSTAITQGTALVLDTDYMDVLYKRGLDIQITNSHSTDYLSGMQRIRADIRAGIAVRRTGAVCSVTGL